MRYTPGRNLLAISTVAQNQASNPWTIDNAITHNGKPVIRISRLSDSESRFPGLRWSVDKKNFPLKLKGGDRMTISGYYCSEYSSDYLINVLGNSGSNLAVEFCLRRSDSTRYYRQIVPMINEIVENEWVHVSSTFNMPEDWDNLEFIVYLPYYGSYLISQDIQLYFGGEDTECAGSAPEDITSPGNSISTDNITI